MVGNAGDWSDASLGLTVGPDPSPPEADSLYINNDAPVTSSRAVTLTMDAHDQPPTSGMLMYHRNENEPEEVCDPTSPNWVPYKHFRTWTLSAPPGMKTEFFYVHRGWGWKRLHQDR